MRFWREACSKAAINQPPSKRFATADAINCAERLDCVCFGTAFIPCQSAPSAPDFA
jgi:hypothetical protein